MIHGASHWSNSPVRNTDTPYGTMQQARPLWGSGAQPHPALLAA